MNKQKVKDGIIKKFGTMSRFCQLSGYDRYELQKVFSLKEPGMKLAQIFDLCKKTRKDAESGKDITPQLRKKINKSLEDAGGITKFCADHPEFNTHSVYQISNGNRLTITKKVKELLTVLNIDTHDRERTLSSAESEA